MQARLPDLGIDSSKVKKKQYMKLICFCGFLIKSQNHIIEAYAGRAILHQELPVHAISTLDTRPLSGIAKYEPA